MDQRKSMVEGHRVVFGKTQRLARATFDPIWQTQPYVRDVGPITQDKTGRVGVVDLAGPTQPFLDLARCLVGEA
jgi:hypothetical protein